MKYLGTNFIAKIKAWVNANFATKTDFEQHAVWTKGEGENSIVAAYNDHFMLPTASGKRATAEGSATASGSNSHAEGYATASGSNSHAEGSATASGSNSHAEGYATASGDYSHAEGMSTKAIAYYSHAEGNATKAQGMYSHAEGWDTKAIGSSSHAEGWLTTAKGPGSHAEGYHNVENSNCIHSVGIGDGRYDSSGKNAEYIYMLAKNDYTWQDDPKNGYKYLIGVGGYDGISTDNSKYKSILEVISDIDSTLKVKADLVDGKIPLELLGNLDMVLFEVVRELPTTNIKKHIYLMKVSELESGAKNLYAEYIYTGDITATYDASKWEKLGVKLIETDLSDYYTKEETDSLILIAKNSAINIHNEDNSQYITLDINDPKITDEDDSKVNISMFDIDYPCFTTINAKEGFTHITDEGFTSNLDGNGLSITVNYDNNPKSIEITTNKYLTEEEQDYGYSPVDISLTDGDNSVRIDAINGFILKNGERESRFSAYGLNVRGANRSSSILDNSIGIAVGSRLAINLATYDDECSITFGTGYDNKFKISCPVDNTEGGVISGIKSLTAFANPSATKVWATDGSTVDLSTKANTSDLDAKANKSDVLLKKSASGGYYIEENNNAVGKKAFAANTNCIASGSWAFAEGVSNALIYCAHSEGYYTSATGFASHALGSYNITNQNAIHSVGIGDSTTRKNAEYIYVKNNKNSSAIVDDPKNGYKYLIGVGGYDGISTDNTTYKSVQEVIADLTARIEQLETLVANCVSISNVDEQTN